MPYCHLKRPAFYRTYVTLGFKSHYCPGWRSFKFKLPKNVCSIVQRGQLNDDDLKRPLKGSGINNSPPLEVILSQINSVHAIFI
jgi:hypothetical protein